MLYLSLLLILFVATFIRSAFGFGEALIAVPLLALVMPVEVAVPVAVLASITVSVVAVAQDWRHIELGSARRLLVATLFGVPLGLWLLKAAPESVVKILLGTVIILFSSYLLIQRGGLRLRSDKSAPVFGFLAGVFGGAYGMNGPPLVAFGTLRGWSPQQFRATLQGYFLPASLVVMAGYGATGLWTMEVSRYYAVALPVIVIAIVAGRVANQYFNARVFSLCVHVGLILVGLGLLWQGYRVY